MSMPRRYIPTLLISVLLTGCISFPGQPGEQPRLYRLDAVLADNTAVAKRDLVIAVGLPQAQPGADSAAMAYVQQAHQVEYFASSRWADTPARMLEPLLLQALGSCGSFRAVVSNVGAVAADYRLDSEWLRLQQEFDRQPSRMHLTLRVQLVNMKTRQVVAAQEIDEVEPAASENAYGGV
ncbi:MAG TPA: ABC-type transport auxiliary lipoprotein family protein, partial [Gallionellaceae bacterium]|nr:ABC-type transport auxiliary lipoprotein family protein [Gallionellaceae bacterium]